MNALTALHPVCPSCLTAFEVPRDLLYSPSEWGYLTTEEMQARVQPAKVDCYRCGHFYGTALFYQEQK